MTRVAFGDCGPVESSATPLTDPLRTETTLADSVSEASATGGANATHQPPPTESAGGTFVP